MTKRKISFRILHILLLSLNLRIGLFGLLVELLSSFLLMSINSKIFIFNLILNELLALEAPLVMEK